MYLRKELLRITVLEKYQIAFKIKNSLFLIIPTQIQNCFGFNSLEQEVPRLPPGGPVSQFISEA